MKDITERITEWTQYRTIWHHWSESGNQNLGDLLVEAKQAIESLTARLTEAEAALHEAGDGDTWRDTCHRMEYELEWRDTQIETMRGLLREVADEWDRINGWILKHPTRAATPITLLRSFRERVTAALEFKP
jgi:hypothetical protein